MAFLFNNFFELLRYTKKYKIGPGLLWVAMEYLYCCDFLGTVNSSPLSDKLHRKRKLRKLILVKIVERLKSLVWKIKNRNRMNEDES